MDPAPLPRFSREGARWQQAGAINPPDVYLRRKPRRRGFGLAVFDLGADSGSCSRGIRFLSPSAKRGLPSLIMARFD